MIFNEFQNNVIQWSTDRGIIQNGTVYSQCLKLASEFGELCDAIAKGDTDGIMDGIGDCQVVAVNVAQLSVGRQLAEPEIDACSRAAHARGLKGVLATTMRNIATIFATEANFNQFESAQELTKCLYALSVLLEVSYTACLETAWNEIKDRKGYLNENGVFIKEGG